MRVSFADAIMRTSLVLGAVLVVSSPALAQDAFNSTADTGNQTNNTGNFTGAQTQQGGNASAPQLQGATNGTIGPQGGDATVIQGVNTAAPCGQQPGQP